MSPTRHHRTLFASLMACFILTLPGAALGQAVVGEIVIVDPEPTEALFVDPIRDELEPGLAAVDPRAAEIEPWRFDVRPSRAELPPARANIRLASIEPSSTLFIDPAGAENELDEVETVGGSVGLVLVDRVTRRPAYAEQVALRRSRFGRPETPRPRPPFDPLRPLGPRPAAASTTIPAAATP